MANLLPETEKKQIAEQFIFRLSIIFLILLSISLIIAIISLLPSFFISSTNEVRVSEEALILKKAIEFKKNSAPVGLLKSEKIKTNFVSDLAYFDFLPILKFIADSRPNGLVATKFFFEPVGDKFKVVIFGKTDSRLSLINFIDKLRKENLFEEVDFPVSNLVKSGNINFSGSLIVSSVKK